MTPEEKAAAFALKIACSSSVEPGIRTEILRLLREAASEARAQALRDAIAAVEEVEPDSDWGPSYALNVAEVAIHALISGEPEGLRAAPPDPASTENTDLE